MTIYEDMLSAYTNTPEENLRNADFMACHDSLKTWTSLS